MQAQEGLMQKIQSLWRKFSALATTYWDVDLTDAYVLLAAS
jgi:hypothetical protein